MRCVNHPDFEATGACAACGCPLCDYCQIQMGWNRYCFKCKELLAREMLGETPGGPPRPAQVKPTCEEATQALIYAVIGIFCCGIVFGILAIIKSNEAKRRIRRYGLSGEGMATAAYTIGIIDIVWGSIPLLIWFISSVINLF